MVVDARARADVDFDDEIGGLGIVPREQADVSIR